MIHDDAHPAPLNLVYQIEEEAVGGRPHPRRRIGRVVRRVAVPETLDEYLIPHNGLENENTITMRSVAGAGLWRSARPSSMECSVSPDAV
jgi:hypothetical protein